MVIWQAWECQNGGVAGWGLMGSPRVHDPIHFNASLASLKREYDPGSFGMPREGAPADKEVSWPCGFAEGRRPFFDNGPLAVLTESTTQKVGEVLSPAAGGGGGWKKRNLLIPTLHPLTP